MAKLVTSSDLDIIVRKERRPAVVLFFGKWCGDCREFEPTWNRWVKDRRGTLLMVEVLRGGPEWKDWNLDEIPTVASFADGTEVGRVAGSISEDDLRSLPV